MKTQSSSSVTPDLFTTQGPYRGDTPAGAVGGRARVESLAPEGPASPVLHVGWGLSIAAHEHLATTQVSHGKLPVAKKKTPRTSSFSGYHRFFRRFCCRDEGNMCGFRFGRPKQTQSAFVGREK